MDNKTRAFIFVGKSGSGKGTQIGLLKNYISEKYNKTVYHIEMGDILRKFFEEEGLAKEILMESTNQHGKFLPDFLINALLVSKVINLIDKESILIFDGYPRNSFQLKTIKNLLEYFGYDKPLFINLNISRETAKERMSLRGRIDDHREAIDNRLDNYDSLVLPMIEEAKKDAYFNYIGIKGEETVDNVYKNILETLGF